MGQSQGRLLDEESVSNLRSVSTFTPGELQRLYQQFSRIDSDSSGSLSRDELISIPGLADNPLLDRLIAIFDKDKNETVDFNEFVEGFNVVFGQSSSAKLRLAFEVYDHDGDGFISNSDLYLVLEPMVGTNLTPEQLQQVVDKTILKADKDGDGVVSFEEFEQFAEAGMESLIQQFSMSFEQEARLFQEETDGTGAD